MQFVKFLLLLILFLGISGCSNIDAAPQTKEWTNRLNQVLELENQSVAQYELHRQKFNVHMPYRMIIPQEYDHVNWISGILNANGVKPIKNYPPINGTKTLQEAYTVDRNLEADLLPKYQWLIENSKNTSDTDTLRTVHGQTQMHYNMFSRALQMHGPMGPMMQDGMMHHSCPYCRNW